MHTEKFLTMSEVQGLEKGFCLPRHMAEHIYMFSGESVKVKMKAKRFLMNELMDWFGKDFHIVSDDGEEIIINVICNQQAMRFWALQYGPYVEVLSPESLRQEIVKSVQIMRDTYLEKTE